LGEPDRARLERLRLQSLEQTLVDEMVAHQQDEGLLLDLVPGRVGGQAVAGLPLVVDDVTDLDAPPRGQTIEEATHAVALEAGDDGEVVEPGPGSGQDHPLDEREAQQGHEGLRDALPSQPAAASRRKNETLPHATHPGPRR
jgi:hypothetical protein